MSTATALVLEAPGRLVAHEIEVPEPLPGEALLRVEACGLCGTDHEMFTGAMPAALPLVPGHEVIGTIEAATPEFLSVRSLAEGDRVALEVFQRCGDCGPCRSGAYPLCRRHGLRDSYGNSPLSSGAGLWGGYATHVVLTTDAVVHRVPAGLDPVHATLFNPLGAGIRWGVTLPGVREGDVVAVLGPGLRGLGAVAAASAAKAGFILLTGAGGRDADRLELGRLLGATEAVDVTQADPRALLKERVGGLADVVVDVTAAAPAAFVQALDLVRPGGTVVVAGTRGAHPLREFNPDRIVLKELRLLGARGVDGAAYSAALDLLAADQRLRTLPRRTVGLDPEALSELLTTMAGGDAPPLHAVVVP
ncbi:zinc-dependent alcohol dehydrogenase [Streptomyces gilvus]|uniref:zinc-dependent alcohol dehydrogenase n=1 Tax=Streptomyces gilvus TaxID=2920937 RepID=UPI001F0E1C35|nr:alcohol dehydrogenase catalytic domain-containing protein [Streptomyces sp. CME 23]MCH5677572.1 alcohol dehydrogenase catalytic domain-containing protein [Streptomyces sp. CME 23]